MRATAAIGPDVGGFLRAFARALLSLALDATRTASGGRWMDADDGDGGVGLGVTGGFFFANSPNMNGRIGATFGAFNCTLNWSRTVGFGTG